MNSTYWKRLSKKEQKNPRAIDLCLKELSLKAQLEDVRSDLSLWFDL